MKRRILLLALLLFITFNLAFHLNLSSILLPESINNNIKITYTAAQTGADSNIFNLKSNRYVGLFALPFPANAMMLALANGTQRIGVYFVFTSTKATMQLLSNVAAEEFRVVCEKNDVLPEKNHEIGGRTNGSFHIRPVSGAVNTS